MKHKAFAFIRPDGSTVEYEEALQMYIIAVAGYYGEHVRNYVINEGYRVVQVEVEIPE